MSGTRPGGRWASVRVGHDDVSGLLGCDVGVERPQHDDRDDAADELGDHVARDRGGRDPGEGVGEHAADVDRGVREAGRAGEEVRRADVGADRGRRGAGALGAGEREDHEQQAERRDHLREQVRRRRAVLGRDAHGGDREHAVRGDRAGDAAGDLRRDVGERAPPAQAAEARVDERDDRVEVRAGDRAEHEDDRVEPGGGRRGVLEQLEADVVWREALRGDPGADHDRGEKRRAEELGEQAPPQRGVHLHGVRRA